MKTIKISQLRIGQRFSFIPSAWHGPCCLTEKWKRIEYNVEFNPFKMKPKVLYDLKYDTNVVNPPGVDYGVPAETRVRLLSRKPQLSRKGYRGGYIV